MGLVGIGCAELRSTGIDLARLEKTQLSQVRLGWISLRSAVIGSTLLITAGMGWSKLGCLRASDEII